MNYEPVTMYWYDVKAINHWFEHVEIKNTVRDKDKKLFVTTIHTILGLEDAYKHIVKSMKSLLKDFEIDIEIKSENQKILIDTRLLSQRIHGGRKYFNPVLTKYLHLNSDMRTHIRNVLWPTYLMEYEIHCRRLDLLENKFGDDIGRMIFLFDEECVLRPTRENIRDILDFIPEVKL